MFDFFKGKQPITPDLEQVIFDIAEHQKDADYHLLYGLLRDRQVYLPADKKSFPDGKEGTTFVTGPGDAIKVRFSRGPDQRPCVFAFTQSSHASLRDGYIEMTWPHTLQMALRLGDEWGLVLQGSTSWVIFDQQRIQYIHKHYE